MHEHISLIYDNSMEFDVDQNNKTRMMMMMNKNMKKKKAKKIHGMALCKRCPFWKSIIHIKA